MQTTIASSQIMLLQFWKFDNVYGVEHIFLNCYNMTLRGERTHDKNGSLQIDER